MVGRVRWCGVGIACALALVPAAAPAGAAPRPPLPLFTQIRLPATNDYRADLLMFGDLVVIGARSGQVAAAYAVHGRAGRERVAARFGSLGRVSAHVDLRPGGPRKCFVKGRAVLRGRVSFRGEGGYTRVEARSARGTFVGIDVDRCRAELSRSEPFLPFRGPTTRLEAISRRPGRLTSIETIAFPGRERASLSASVEERRGKMSIFRSAQALLGGERSLITSGPGILPAFAVVRPPKPFSGSAVYAETGPGTSTWTGTLSAWMPGLGPTRIAGRSFSSGLCRRTVEESACITAPPVRRPLQAMLQGSGSQSQLPGAERLSWSR